MSCHPDASLNTTLLRVIPSTARNACARLVRESLTSFEMTLNSKH